AQAARFPVQGSLRGKKHIWLRRRWSSSHSGSRSSAFAHILDARGVAARVPFFGSSACAVSASVTWLTAVNCPASPSRAGSSRRGRHGPHPRVGCCRIGPSRTPLSVSTAVARVVETTSAGNIQPSGHGSPPEDGGAHDHAEGPLHLPAG